MKSRFRNFFQYRRFDDPELTRRAQNLQIILLGLFAATCLWAWYPIFVQGGVQIAVALIVLTLEISMFALLKAGRVVLAGSLLSTTLWLALTVFMATFGGIRNSGFVTYSVVVVIASLTLGARAGHTFAILTVVAGIAMVLAENNGFLPPYAYEPNVTILISQSLNLVGISLLLFLSMRNLNKAMVTAVENERTQKEINKLLEVNRAELELRSEISEQRNTILETVAEVSRLAGQAKSEAALVEQAAQLLANNIKLDFVRIFLLDQTEENALLCASNVSNFEKEQLSVHKHKLDYPYFQRNTVQYRTGGFAYHIRRPTLLPEAKTTFSLPLKSGERLLGLINIQTLSPMPAQFDEQTLQTFADQIALSIENIRLFNQLQTRVREISVLAQNATQEAWNKLRVGETLGYHYDRLNVLPAKEELPAAIAEKINNKQVAAYTTSDTQPHSRLVAPIIVRENVVGIIGYEENDPGYIWQESEKSLLETVASRVSLALENSRLVAEAERRAAQERAVSQAANRMRETLDLDTVMKTAALEIKRTLKAEKAEVRLQTPSEENPIRETPAKERP